MEAWAVDSRLMQLTLWCSSVTFDRKMFCFEFVKITASSEWYETWWLLWHLECEHTNKLRAWFELSGLKEIVILVLFGQKWPTMANEWEIDKKYILIQQIFVCTIYKSATMQKKSTPQWRGETKTSRVKTQQIHSHTNTYTHTPMNWCECNTANISNKSNNSTTMQQGRGYTLKHQDCKTGTPTHSHTHTQIYTFKWIGLVITI